MIRADAMVIGGGPAGSTCARELRKGGWDVIVVDRATFPRDKVCAGWLTPEVFPLLELDPQEYRSAGLTLQEITAFRTGVLGGRLTDTGYPRIISYAIRRCEFDHFLLRRTGAQVLDGTPIGTLRREGGNWIVNETITAPVLIGAGGHFCPVARHLRGGLDTTPPIVAKEAEFRLDGRRTDVAEHRPELFFCKDLEGYGWCVRKGDYLNVGIGRRDKGDFGDHVASFTAFLEQRGALVPASGLRWRGHAYLASGAGSRPLVGDGAMLIGDAAGLAYPESGEGIRPAIESGRLAARTLIGARGRLDAAALRPYAEAIKRLHPAAPPHSGPVHAALVAVGRWLLDSPAFTRHIVLDRWFLRAQ